ncbi:MAG: ribonuclease [Ferruginibacter sp.]|uniref:ribonuclease Z n=1 Tax=Ferruginibacter sp. TaxID=1940288 RepID=UPI0026586FC6|nr:ribonuclease Z [Ferruginibacter sp.]MDB5276292.1 ribonuclease [Ferruginibacter sp.]
MLAITILGNNSAIPAWDRNPTAQILQSLEECYLIDCGEGTQTQMSKYKIRRSRINHIFISHLHGDHYFGLIGLLTSMSLLSRTQDLHLHAPAALEQIIQLQLSVASVQLSYRLYFHPITANEIIVDDSKITVESFAVKHRIECWGFLFTEKKNPRKIDRVRIKAYEIPVSFYDKLQKGEDYVTKKGTIIPNEEVTVPGPKPKKYAYCADTIYDESLVDKVKLVDMLYHEATYLKALHSRAAERFHSTTIQAAGIAYKGQVKKLLIGHFSSKYEVLDEFLTEATAVFENTELALQGVSYRI